jgi:hypothetical protein
MADRRHQRSAGVQCDGRGTAEKNVELENNPEMTNSSRHFVSIAPLPLELADDYHDDDVSEDATVPQPFPVELILPLWPTLSLVLVLMDVTILVYRLTNLCHRFRMMTSTPACSETRIDEDEVVETQLTLNHNSGEVAITSTKRSVDSVPAVTCTGCNSSDTFVTAASGSNHVGGVATVLECNRQTAERQCDSGIYTPQRSTCDSRCQTTTMLIALQSTVMSKLVLFAVFVMVSSVVIINAKHWLVTVMTSIVGQKFSVSGGDLWRQEAALQPVMADLKTVNNRIRHELTTSSRQFSVTALSHMDVIVRMFKKGEHIIISETCLAQKEDDYFTL